MKPLLIKTTTIIWCAVALTACYNKPLSDADVKLTKELRFDKAVTQEIRNLTDSVFVKAIPNQEALWCFKDSLNYVAFENKKVKGLTFNISEKKSTMIVKRLRKRLADKGYVIYISDANYGYAPDKITVLKTNNQFDALRFEGTSGVNYDIYVEDIIKELNDWDKKYKLKIIGVGFDFVEADIKQMPENLEAYAQELYEFCPDIVEQGTGSVAELKNELKGSEKLFLWWD